LVNIPIPTKSTRFPLQEERMNTKTLFVA